MTFGTRSLALGFGVIQCVFMAGCAGRSQERFASPVAPLSGCYVFEYGPWPGEISRVGEGGETESGLPDPGALPAVIELREERVGRTEDPSVDGRIHEVRTHGRPGRGILHYWRMVDSGSMVIWTGGPRGFRLEVDLAGRQASGTAVAYAEGSAEGVLAAPLSGVRSPCPRQAVRKS